MSWKASDAKLAAIDDKIEGQRVLTQETNTELRALKEGQLQHAEALAEHVAHIIETMGANSRLLEEKFDEFSDLLQKSNTEALVQVMEEATRSFNEQMRELIDRLVKENFEALNQSVERLNTWQQENKEMIAQLTEQFRSVVEGFQIAEEEIQKVVSYTQELVGEGGKLAAILEELRTVLVEENKLVDVSNKLQDVAQLAYENTENLKVTSRNLQQWVAGHQQLQDATYSLIAKLEEINKIKDITHSFWQEIKSNLEEAAGLVKKASQRLSGDLQNIDSAFYNRINNSFQQLDELIQSWMRHHTNGR